MPTPLGVAQAYHFQQTTPADKRDRAVIAIYGNRSSALNCYTSSLSAFGQVISLDMPGYGEPKYGYSDAPRHGPEHFELALAAYTHAVTQYVCRDLGIAESHITFFGCSMGATAAAMAYASYPQSHLLLTVPFLSVTELFSTHVGKQMRRLLPAFFDPTRHASSDPTKATKFLFWVSQLPFYLGAFCGRTVSRIFTSMAFPAGLKCAAGPGFVSNGMDNRARLRAVADVGKHTGSVFILQGARDHLMGPEYGRALAKALNANPAHPVDVTLYDVPEGDHRSRAQPAGRANSAPPWFSGAQRQLRKENEAAAHKSLQDWSDKTANISP